MTQANPVSLTASIAATASNGKRLLEDARLLFDWDRFSTSLALAVLAQEEFAKAFLLQLVSDGALPWLPEVQRSMSRHQCKHLLAIVMEWLPPLDIHEAIEQHTLDKIKHERRMSWLQRSIDRFKQGNFSPDIDDPEPVEPEIFPPPDVVAALNIYLHKEIKRLSSGRPLTNLDQAAGRARKIADGSLDRKKQSAFYVDVSKTGEIGLHPGLISRDEATEEIRRAGRLSDDLSVFSDEYRKLKVILTQVFSSFKGSDDKR